MTRETKAGLIVTASFLGLLGAVIAKKFMDPSTPAKDGKEVAVASNTKDGVEKKGAVTQVSPAAMGLVPVPPAEGLVLTTGEENKGAPAIPPLGPTPPEPAPGGIPPLPGSPAVPPLPGETPKAEVPPLPGSIPPPPPAPASGGVNIPPPPIPKPMEPVVSPSPVIPPPVPAPAIPPAGSPEIIMPVTPVPPPAAPGLSGTPAPSAGIPAPVSAPPPPSGVGIGAGAITPPPPPPPAPGFNSAAPPALSSTSPMPKSTSTTFNVTSGPGVRSEFIPADPSAIGRPVGSIPPTPMNTIAPVPAAVPPALPTSPNQIISAPPIPGTTPVPITPGAGAVLTIPSDNGPLGSPANGSTVPSAPIPSVAPLAPAAPVNPPAATLAPPRVDSWSEQSYVAVAGDTYDIISQKIYRSNDYGKALQLWNENHPRARFDAPKNGLIVPGQEIYYPPTTELARKFGNYLPKVSPVGAIAK